MSSFTESRISLHPNKQQRIRSKATHQKERKCVFNLCSASKLKIQEKTASSRGGKYRPPIPGLLLPLSNSASVPTPSELGLASLTFALLSSNFRARFRKSSYDIPKPTTPSRVKSRDQGPRTCHQRKTTQRSWVSHVKSMCCYQQLPRKGNG
jgi:hypothetical protein